MEMTCDDNVVVLDINNTAGSTIGYTLPPAKHGTNHLRLMLKSFLPIEVKVNLTVDDNRRSLNLTAKKQ